MTNAASRTGNGGWQGFRLAPDDVLFFRDGRPSTRGDDHYLRSLFPPHPSTLYGALRTRRLLDAGVSLRELRRRRQERWNELPEVIRQELGEWQGFGTLELRGPWLVRGDQEVLLPAPADLAVIAAPRRELEPDQQPQDEPKPPVAERVVRFLAGDRSAGGHSHRGVLLQPFEWQAGTWTPWEGAAPRATPGWYITPAGMAAWAAGCAPELSELVHSEGLWAAEPRVGVGLEAERRVGEDGQLYTFGFVRLHPGVSLGFDVRGVVLKAKRRVVLGGEGRSCWLEAGPTLPDGAQAVPKALGMRLALGTPALSKNGSALPGFAALNATGELAGHRCRLAGACITGHTLAGGWDLAKAGPKPLRRAIPAGSVYLVQPEGEKRPSAADLHGITLSDYPEEHLAQQGFGLVLAGTEPQL
jgi:CRISPR-associated protein Cmr3